MILSSVSVASAMFSHWHVSNSETGSFPLVITTFVCFQLINTILQTWLECTKTPALHGIVGNISRWSMYLSAVCVCVCEIELKWNCLLTFIISIYWTLCFNQKHSACDTRTFRMIMSRCSLSSSLSLSLSRLFAESPSRHHSHRSTDCRNDVTWWSLTVPFYIIYGSQFLAQKIMLL